MTLPAIPLLSCGTSKPCKLSILLRTNGFHPWKNYPLVASLKTRNPSPTKQHQPVFQDNMRPSSAEQGTISSLVHNGKNINGCIYSAVNSSLVTSENGRQLGRVSRARHDRLGSQSVSQLSRSFIQPANFRCDNSLPVHYATNKLLFVPNASLIWYYNAYASHVETCKHIISIIISFLISSKCISRYSVIMIPSSNKHQTEQLAS